VAVGPRGGERVREEVRALASATPAATCDGGESKVKPVNVPRPAYTEEARAASIEGKVRVELTVNERGAVSGAKVLQGLGFGLDEAALAAVREATFEPATKCGVAIASTFVLSVRFVL